VCKEYELKEWCGLERRAIFSLIEEHKSNDVMRTPASATSTKHKADSTSRSMRSKDA
jgi:hypothetical protein